MKIKQIEFNHSSWCVIAALTLSLQTMAHESYQVVAGINAEGTSTGYVLSSGDAYQGFVRRPSGRTEIFDAPGAGSGPGQGTVARSINDRGEVGGYEVDTNNTLHGFLRTRAGAVFVFEAPGAGSAANQRTIVAGPSGNALGVVTGWFYDENGVVHGWKRAANGAIQVIDTPGHNRDTYTSNEVRYGFVRWTPGAITTFDATQLATTRGQLR
jgi:hypothetical protein